MAALAGAVIFTFTALMSEVAVRGALANLVVPPAAGRGTLKRSSPKTITTSFTVSMTVPAMPLPSAAAAVMVTLPAAMPVAAPVAASMVALVGSELVHFTALGASAGSTAAVNVRFPPTATDGSAGVMTTEVAFTVMLTVTVPFTLLPSVAVAVMTAVPLATPVTFPVASTVAFVSSPVLQVTSFFAASAGSTVAVNC